MVQISSIVWIAIRGRGQIVIQLVLENRPWGGGGCAWRRTFRGQILIVHHNRVVFVVNVRGHLFGTAASIDYYLGQREASSCLGQLMVVVMIWR